MVWTHTQTFWEQSVGNGLRSGILFSQTFASARLSVGQSSKPVMIPFRDIVFKNIHTDHYRVFAVNESEA
jgi:hypothetical protein